MADFPGRPDGTNPLSRYPLSESWEYVVPTIDSPTEGMYESRRPMNTRKRKIFTVAFDTLPVADIELIEDHFLDVGMSESFTWSDRSGGSFVVQYNEPISVGFVVEGYQSISPLIFREV